MELMEDLLAVDNETLADVKSMEELYDEIRADPLYRRLFEMATVHTAERFGVQVPDDAYERMARAIEEEGEWAEIEEIEWFREAQELADEEAFFHWELEFPEAFFGGEGTKMEEAGFDAVIGNPPYVRQEQLAETKGYLESEFETYHGVADLYVYFVEKGGSLLGEEGSFGQITSNKFMRSNYGRSIRNFLTSEVSLKTIVDFGDLPVFGSVSAYPSIVIFDRIEKANDQVRIARVLDLDFSELQSRLDDISYKIWREELQDSQWSLAPKEHREVLDRIESASGTLEEYLDSEIKYGVKTGLNDAFVISEQERRNLISEDRSSEELIKPLATGRNIRRFNVENDGKYLIFTRRGTDIEEYPAIRRHLLEYKEKLQPRPTDYTGTWQGRKPGDYEWYEIQDTVEYWKDFESEKICYPVIANSPRFALDTKKYYLNDKCFIISEVTGPSLHFLILLLHTFGSITNCRHFKGVTTNSGLFI